MSKANYFEFLTAQRYFHLVALKVGTDYSIESYWRDSGVGRKRRKYRTYDFPDFKVEQVRIQSETPYYFGSLDYSVNGDKQPPYQYDLFAIELKKQGILVLGFPFRQLAKTVLNNLIDGLSSKLKGIFNRADINKLIKTNHEIDFIERQFTAYFATIDLRLTGDSKITSVNLDGDRPMESDLYKDVFKGLLEQEYCKLDKCSIKLETIGDGEEMPKTRSIVHIDKFGNYKLYIHGSGNNIFTIPYMFNLLRRHKCLETTFNNPIDKLNDE